MNIHFRKLVKSSFFWFVCLLFTVYIMYQGGVWTYHPPVDAETLRVLKSLN